MKATVNTKDLIKALAQVNSIPKARQLAVLHSMLMEFSSNKLAIESTDLQCVIRVEIKAEADTPFKLVLPRATVNKFVNSSTIKDAITFTSGGADPHLNATLEQTGVGKAVVQAVTPTDFPPIPTAPADLTWHTLDAKWFCRMLGILLTGCAKEESRPVLTGISFKDGAMASADGFRLVCVKSDKLNLGLKEIIIPSQSAMLAKRLFEKEETLMVGIQPERYVIHFATK